MNHFLKWPLNDGSAILKKLFENKSELFTDFEIQKSSSQVLDDVDGELAECCT